MNRRVSYEKDDEEEWCSIESDDEFDPTDSDDDIKKKSFMAKKAAPKRKVPTGRGQGGALKMPTALTGGLSEYEKIRQGNIAEREAMLQDLMADFDSFKKDSGIGAAKKAPPKKRRRVEYDSDDEGGFRGGKVKVEGSRKSARLSAAPEDKGKMGSEITYKEGYDPKSRGLAEHLSSILPLVSQSREGLWVPEVRHTIYSMESLGRF